MLRILSSVVFVICAASVFAAERVFDFGETESGRTPEGFVAAVTGQGGPGEWKTVEDDAPSAFSPLSPGASGAKRRVLAQLSRDAADERFPLLYFGGESFRDFTFTARFKCVEGRAEQMAGLAFRIQDEKNYYVVRASALGNTFRLYTFVNGVRSQPIGPEIKIASGVWHEMSVTCQGSGIRCSLNGKEVIPPLTDYSFSSGKLGFWTKSDSVSYFADAKVQYTPMVPGAQRAVDELMERHPKLGGVKLFGYRNGELLLLGASGGKDVGKPGTDVEANVIKNDKVYTAKGRETITVILPVKDRNGDAIAALHVTMKSFAGQTENNAIARALPYRKMVSDRLQTAQDLLD